MQWGTVRKTFLNARQSRSRSISCCSTGRAASYTETSAALSRTNLLQSSIDWSWNDPTGLKRCVISTVAQLTRSMDGFPPHCGTRQRTPSLLATAAIGVRVFALAVSVARARLPCSSRTRKRPGARRQHPFWWEDGEYGRSQTPVFRFASLHGCVQKAPGKCLGSLPSHGQRQTYKHSVVEPEFLERLHREKVKLNSGQRIQRQRFEPLLDLGG